MPEEAIIVDRARGFMGEFAVYLEQDGVRLDFAALASVWHVGKMERHDGIWNSMFDACCTREADFRKRRDAYGHDGVLGFVGVGGHGRPRWVSFGSSTRTTHCLRRLLRR